MIKINTSTSRYDVINFVTSNNIICLFYIIYDTHYKEDIINYKIKRRNFVSVYHKWMSIDQIENNGIEICNNEFLVLMSNRFITDQQITEIEDIIKNSFNTIDGVNYDYILRNLNDSFNKNNISEDLVINLQLIKG